MNQIENPGQPIFKNTAISIEILLQPEKEYNDYVAHILSFYDNKRSETLIFAQWRSGLIARHKTGPNHNNTYKEIGLSHVLPKGKTRFITITSDNKGTSIYLDGLIAREYPNHSLITENQRISGQILIGNSAIGNSPWNGNIMGLAIYNNLLNSEQVLHHYQSWTQNNQPSLQHEEGVVAFYRFNEQSGNMAYDQSRLKNNLIIPTTFNSIEKKVLGAPWKEFSMHRSYLQDVVINIVGFIPFGFFFPAFLRQAKTFSNNRIYLFTILVGGGMSLAIELLQVYLPSRDSSLTDLICNTLGTIIGLILFKIYHKGYKLDLIRTY